MFSKQFTVHRTGATPRLSSIAALWEAKRD